MNKKIIAGLMSVAAVGSFWACGSGDIHEPDMADEFMSMSFVPNGVPDTSAIKSSLIDPAKKNCVGDCAIIYADVLADQGAPSNPSENNGNNSNTSNGNGSGNSAGNGTNSGTTGTGTPNNPIIINPSAGDNGNSSNTGDSGSGSGTTETPVITPSDGFGTCGTSVQGDGTVEQNTSVRFKFSFDNGVSYSVSEKGNAEYIWTYGDGVGDGTENKANSAGVTFASPGDKNVSVTVKIGGDEKTVACPIHVNGSPISGCSCAPSAELVDYSTGATAAWEVKGCESSAEITGYKWNVSGAKGTMTENGASATFAFSEAGVATAEVTVSNAEETNKVVQCKAVEGSNGPKNNISLPYDKVLEANTVYTVTANCSSTLTFQFSGEGNCNESTCTVSVDGGAGVAVGCYATAPATGKDTFSIKSECGIKLACY